MPKTTFRTRRLLFLLLLAAPLLAHSAAASDAGGLEGYWEGAIEIPGRPLAISLNFAKKGDAWSGEVSIPAQRAKDLPLSQIKISGSDVSFAMTGVPEGVYTAKKKS